VKKRLSTVALGVMVFGLSACGNTGPNYDLAPTIACLRSQGDKVSGPYRRDFEGVPNPMIEVQTRSLVHGHHIADFLSFAPSAAKAGDESNATDYGLVTRRNVVFDIEGDVGFSSFDAPIVDCLRSR